MQLASILDIIVHDGYILGQTIYKLLLSLQEQLKLRERTVQKMSRVSRASRRTWGACGQQVWNFGDSETAERRWGRKTASASLLVRRSPREVTLLGDVRTTTRSTAYLDSHTADGSRHARSSLGWSIIDSF